MIGTWSRFLIHAAHVQAGDAGQHEIEYDDVRSEGAELFQPLFTRFHGDDLVPLMPQAQLDGPADIFVVFDNQDPWHFGSVCGSDDATVPGKAALRAPLHNDHNRPGAPAVRSAGLSRKARTVTRS